MMVKKYALKVCTAFVAVVSLLVSTNVLAKATYGFGSAGAGCSLWTMLFPISFQQPNNDMAAYFYNIIWIDDDSIKGMDEYYDFYQTMYNQSAWPSAVATGTDTPKCSGATECPVLDSKLAPKGYVTSAYDAIKQKYPSDTVKISTGQPIGSGGLTWRYLPVRKLKLLRIEVFIHQTQYSPAVKTFVEPIYFEYRSTGNGTELKLAEQVPNTADIILPETFSPVLTSDIQVWFQRTGLDNFTDIASKAHIDPLSTTQIERVPESCK